MAKKERPKVAKGLAYPTHDQFMATAVASMKKSLAEGGLPIGAVLVIGHKVVSTGHNERVQKSDPTAHGEISCLRNAGRLLAKDYRRAVLYTTLSPCDMCSGAILLYKIPLVVIGENVNFKGPEEYLQSRGVQLINLNNPECIQIMGDFIKKNPQLWNEDVGV